MNIINNFSLLSLMMFFNGDVVNHSIRRCPTVECQSVSVVHITLRDTFEINVIKPLVISKNEQQSVVALILFSE